MSENKHTPEPWYCENCGEGFDIYDINDHSIIDGSFGLIECEANARRITACVNACAGCVTEVLETVPVGFFNSTYGHPKYLEEITKQRDELLAELEWCAKSLNPNNERTKRVFAVIATAKGEQ